MPTFPIPVFAACVLGFAAIGLWHQRGRASPLVLMLILCAAQSLIIALNQHYGVPGMRPLQPLTAALIPPVAWVAFRGRFARDDLLHALAPLSALAALIVAPSFLDVLLPGLFAVYGSLIIMGARKGADTQPDALLSSGDVPSRIWIVIGAALIASAFSDLLIAALQIAGHGALQPWVVSFFSVGNLLLIGLLTLSSHLQTADAGSAVEAPEQAEPDPQLWHKVQTYMAEREPYLDPDLTLARLARKLGVPAKTLSSTINRATGGNVSRFINEARIKTAQQSMLGGEPVTTAMFASGFNTKSNFNREFRRITGRSPTEWLNENAASTRG